MISMTKQQALRAVGHLHLVLVFFTRLPLPPLRDPVAPLGQALWAVPLVGLLVGAAGAGLWLALTGLGVSDPVAAVLTVAGALLLTGALHEDGFADCADGFWGSPLRPRRLEILRDSRLGTYGALALILLLAARVAALLGGEGNAALALLLAPMLGRMTLPVTMRLLAPARADGLGAGAGRVPGPVVALALALGLGLAALVGGVAALKAAVVMAVIGLLLCWLAWAKIGGYTGDVLGAVAAASETVCLLWLMEAA